MAQGKSGRLKDALKFRGISQAPVHSPASPVHIDRCIHYSGAKSFVSNGRCESFLG